MENYRKEVKTWGYVVSAVMFIIFVSLLVLGFSQLPALKRAYNLMVNGHNVQATIDNYYTGDADHNYFAYYLHYTYEEEGKTWCGVIRYLHKDDGKTDYDGLNYYYYSKIGEKVDVTIDPNSTYCRLTKDVEPDYIKVRTNEIARFSVDGVGLPFTIVFFVVFLIKTSKDKKVDNCTFIQNNKNE